MSDLDCMTIEKFRLWSINALKVFLSCRKKSVDGTFDELTARAFCAWEEKIPVDSSAEEAELRLCAEYKSKLKVGGNVIPDPYSVDNKQWTGEKEGRLYWPSVYISDIALYLNGTSASDIVNKLLNEYKVGKGFRYFQNEWVKEVFIHTISDKHPYCILKSRVTPSQSINSKDYSVWICVEKDNENGIGGKVVSAHCSCTAGMLGSCNHIAGVLFRVENFIKRGETCTDRLSVWNVPKLKTVIKPTKVKDLVWKKAHYAKLPTNAQEESEKARLKQAFTPLSKSQEEDVKDETAMRKKLYNALKDAVPEACFIGNCEKRRYNKPAPNIPANYVSVAVDINNNNTLDKCAKVNAFKEAVSITDEDRSNIKTATLDQSGSETWHEQRKGRITASLFHRVATRVDTIRKDPSTNPSKLVESILGQSPAVQTKAMKHGVSLEPFAKKAYTRIAMKTHKKFKSSDSGLAIDKEYTFIAASADLEVTCQCCGLGLCEIKCPESVKDTKPSAENLDYLMKDNDSGIIYLKQNHSYYYQIQGQLGVCERQYCDLFVFTFHGHQIVRVYADNDFWNDLKQKLMFFWESYVLHALLEMPTSPSDTSNKENSLTCTTEEAQKQLKAILVRPVSARRALVDRINTQSKKKKARSMKPVYLCGVCTSEVVDNPVSDSEQSVQCDNCSLWFHFVCCGLTAADVECSDKWFCVRCK